MRLITTNFMIALTFGLTACSKPAQVTPDPRLVEGESLFIKNCKVCHAQGINGAPILGNNKMWRKRAEQNVETLVKHASEGFGLMPPKGGNATLTDKQIESMVFYMLSQLDNEPKQ